MTQPSSFNVWYDHTLLQIAADSYLDGIEITDPRQVTERLKIGNNDLRPTVTVNGVPGQENQLVALGSQYRGSNEESNVLPGATRMTDSQVNYFLQRFEIVHHYKNDASGFSATLFRDRSTQELTLAFRSTEFAKQERGGDYQRDNAGANIEISNLGFAFGQIKSMEDYYQALKTTLKDANGNPLVPTGTQLNITGYSLGGHLATIFTELHTDEVKHTYLFNAAGRGASNSSVPALLDMYKTLIADPLAPVVGSTQWPATGQRPLMLRDALNAPDPFSTANIYTNARHLWAVAVLREVTFGNLQLGLSGLPSQNLVTGAIAPAVSDKISHLYGMATHDDATSVARSGITPGETSQHRVFVEDQPDLYGDGGFSGEGLIKSLPKRVLGEGDFLRTHSITLLADSLALMQVFARTTATLSQLDIESIFAASSNERAGAPVVPKKELARAESRSLENALSALHEAITGTPLVLSANEGADGFGHLSNREQFHRALVQLDATLERNAGAYRIVPIASMEWVKTSAGFGLFPSETIRAHGIDSAAIVAMAQKDDSEGLAYRYALEQLNPFAVVKASYDDSIQARLKLFDTATGDGQITREWIEDRTQMLLAKIRRNLDNLGYAPTEDSVSTEYRSAKEVVDQLRNLSSDQVAARTSLVHQVSSDQAAQVVFLGDKAIGKGRLVTFGTDRDDSISGAMLGDRLYGGGGSDRIYGQNGSDYLQGDTGSDLLNGGEGADELVGGKDGDSLIGGADFDTYHVRKGDGDDFIIDSIGDSFGGDGRGRIVFLGIDLTGTKIASGHSIWTDGLGFQYRFAGQQGSTESAVLEISKPGESEKITVLGFRDGDLGIALTGSVTPSGLRVIQGDRRPEEFLVTVAVAGGQIVYPEGLPAPDWRNVSELQRNVDASGNGSATLAYNRVDDLGNLITTQIVEARVDGLAGSAGDDLILAGERADSISALGGSDIVEAGLGDDRVAGGDGTDDLSGGAGRDVMFGDADADTLSGGGDQDLLYGGGGDDRLIGGDGDDFLQGGRGNDFLFGGAGNDYLSVGQEIVDLNRDVSTNWALQVQATPTGVAANYSGVNDTLIREAVGRGVLQGDDGDDLLMGGFGDDVLLGGSGRDALNGRVGNDFLSGGDGDDRLIGDLSFVEGVPVASSSQHGADHLRGGLGNDVLDGDGGSDWLYGEEGDDRILGDGPQELVNPGDDFIDGGAGSDFLQGDAGRDTIFGGEGDDQILGDADELPIGADGADLLHGEAGNDRIRGHGGDDTLFGGDGDDELIGDGDGSRVGEQGNDTLNGGAGNDVLMGGAGNDRYEFHLGDGQDTILDTQGNNVVVFGAGITASSLRIEQAIDQTGAGYLVLHYGENDFVTVERGLVGSVQRYEFADGTVWTAQELLRRLPIEQRLNVSAPPGGGVVVGSAAAEHITGGAQNDTYLFGPDGNSDLLVESGGTDTLRFAEGIVLADLIFTRSASGDLNIRTARGDEITIVGHFLGAARRIETIEFADQSRIDVSTLDGLPVSAIDGSVGEDRLIGSVADETLIGHEGNDELAGGAGGDTYVFALGDGNDIVRDNDTSASPSTLDRLQLRGFRPNDVQFARSIDGALGIYSLVSFDSITLPDFYSPRNRIERIEFFADASATIPDAVMLIDELAALATGPAFGTPQTDELTGTSARDQLNGLDGNDLLRGTPDGAPAEQAGDELNGGDGHDILVGGGGDDQLDGGDGDDQISGNGGHDLLLGGEGSDILIGGVGSDVLAGGSGNDAMTGGQGDDAYFYALGDGDDVIVEAGDGTTVDTVVFDAAIAAADVYMGRLANGDLALQLANGGRITVRGQYSDPNARIERVAFADGTVVDAAALAALPRAPILGSPQADALSGTAGADTLIGLGGADVIDGGSGADEIHGGAGADTYRLYRGSGTDIWIDTGINSVSLGEGLTFEGVAAYRNDNDLTLLIRGGSDSARITNYFGGVGQSWRVSDAAGATISIEQLMALTDAIDSDWRAALQQQTVGGIRDGIDAQYERMALVPSGAGVWRQLNPPQISAAVVHQQTFIKETTALIDGTVVSQSNSFNESRTLEGVDVTGQALLVQVQVDHQRIETDAALIQAPSGVQSSSISQQISAVARVDWTETRRDSSPEARSTQASPVIVRGELGVLRRDVSLFQTRSELTGAISDYVAVGESDPGFASTPPDYVRINSISRTDHFTVREVIAGDSDNVIEGGTIVDAGGGNDTVTMSGTDASTLILGGDGNDVLRGAAIMAGENGNDLLEDALHDNNRYLIRAQDTGFDTIRDTFVLHEGLVADRYYPSIGIPNWRSLLVKGLDPQTGQPMYHTLSEGVALGLLPPPPSAEDHAYFERWDYTPGFDLDIVEFDSGISSEDFSVSWDPSGRFLDLSALGQLRARLDMPAEFDQWRYGIERVYFGEGEWLSTGELVAIAGSRVASGTAGDDDYLGTAFSDYYVATAGNDSWNGREGNDAYEFGPGSGRDVIEDGAGVDTLYVAARPEDIVVTREGEYLRLAMRSTADEVRVRWNPALGLAIESVVFNDPGRTVWNAATLEARIEGGVTVLNGSSRADTLNGTAGRDEIYGLAGNDVLTGFSGDDLLDGGTGADTMAGGAGDDVYVVDQSRDVVTELAGQGTDTVQSAVAYTLGADVENLTLTGNAHVRGTGNALNNVIVGNVGNNRLEGGEGNDTLTGDAGQDTLIGGAGNDTFLIDGDDGTDTVSGGDGFDVIRGGAGDDSIRLNGHSGANTVERIDGGAGINLLFGTSANNTFDFSATALVSIAQIDGGLGLDIITGSLADDFIFGGDGNDTLRGLDGNDLLQGGLGADRLTDTAGRNLLDGGAGIDTITGGSGSDFIIGRSDADTINGGLGADVIGFNTGDGQDIINVTAGGAAEKTVSLGGGIRYTDLALRKSGNDLILETSGTESLTFRNWYTAAANKQFVNLQVVSEAMSGYDAGSSNPLLNRKVNQFDFTGLVNAFDAARSSNPTLTRWTMMDQLLAKQLASSDSAAIGGDLAYRYGLSGSLTDISSASAYSILSDSSFGNAQSLRSPASLQEGVVRLV